MIRTEKADNVWTVIHSRYDEACNAMDPESAVAICWLEPIYNLLTSKARDARSMNCKLIRHALRIKNDETYCFITAFQPCDVFQRDDLKLSPKG
jgi:hypothetical protein